MADPHIIDKPQIIAELTYQELRELSYMGASILHEEAIYPVSSVGIPTVIKNTNRPHDTGTLISDKVMDNNPYYSITGIAGKVGYAIIHIEKALMHNDTSFARELLQILDELCIPLEHMACGIESISVLVQENNMIEKYDKLKDRILGSVS